MQDKITTTIKISIVFFIRERYCYYELSFMIICFEKVLVCESISYYEYIILKQKKYIELFLYVPETTFLLKF